MSVAAVGLTVLLLRMVVPAPNAITTTRSAASASPTTFTAAPMAGLLRPVGCEVAAGAALGDRQHRRRRGRRA